MQKLKENDSIITVQFQKDQEEIASNDDQQKDQEKIISNKDQQKVQEKIILNDDQQKVQEKTVSKKDQQKVQEEIIANDDLQKVQEKIVSNDSSLKIDENKESKIKINENEQQTNFEELKYPLSELNQLTKSSQALSEESKSLIERTYLEMETLPNIENEDESTYVLEWEEEEKNRLERTKKLHLSNEKIPEYGRAGVTAPRA